MKNIMKSLCKQLNGWNLSKECDLFDFYSETYYTDYESITLNEYENRLKDN